MSDVGVKDKNCPSSSSITEVIVMTFDISNNDKHMEMNDTDCSGLKHINSQALIHEIRFETVENSQRNMKGGFSFNVLCPLLDQEQRGTASIARQA